MNRRILVIEDHLAAQIVYTRTFAKQGYDVSLMEDGRQAMEFFGITRDLPEIMLIDVNLPGASGLHLVRHLRERLGRSDLILIAISSNEIAQDIPEARMADAIILKPISPAKLVDEVESLVRRRVVLTA
ncbi:MAG: response regulator [Aggregatilineales bacterium]